MKKISSSFLKSLNWLLTSVLMLLGFSTCDSEPGAAMYGTPHADFTIKGKVVNQENMPIPDIEIKCLVEHHGDNRHWFDTIPAVSTDPAGVFHCQFEEFPTDKLRIIATDIDGPQNGSYEKDSTNLTLSSDDYKGNTGSWFKGSVEKEIKFNLKRKDKELQSAKPPVHLFKTKRFYFEVLFQNEASLLEQNQTAFKWTSNPI